MLEPSPKTLPLPSKESLIRVGLVLAEDQQTSIEISNSEQYLINDKIKKMAAETVSVKISSGKLELNGEHYDHLNFKTLTPQNLSCNSGFMLNPVIAGRSFHWKKKIIASYLGEIQIKVENGFLQVVNILPFEQYLSCVVTSEMSAECPVEFIKAQIIAARSWAYVFLNDKHPDSGFDVCNDDDCQRYQGTTFLSDLSIQASQQTAGLFLQDTIASNVLPAYYIKTCGGITEGTSKIFGFENSALISVADSKDSYKIKTFEEYLSTNADNFFCGQAQNLQIEKYLGKVDSGGAHFRWSKTVAIADLKQNLKKHLAINDFSKLVELKTLNFSNSFRITDLELIYITDSGEQKSITLNSQYQIRQVLSPDFLPSSAFSYHVNEQGDIVFKGAGWGHGVGLCQVGAVVMALKKYSYAQILKHYFPNANVVRAY